MGEIIGFLSDVEIGHALYLHGAQKSVKNEFYVSNVEPLHAASLHQAQRIGKNISTYYSHYYLLPTMQINIFVPCFIDQLYPATAVNMLKLLRLLGYTVGYNPNQTCCGQPAYNAGYWAEAKAVGQKMQTDMQALPNHALLVCPSASCTGFVRNTLPKLLEQDKIGFDMQELATFLVDTVGVARLAQVVQPRLLGRAVYHDACSALRECGIKAAPRQLLGLVDGLELVEAADAETCCGFGGTFASKFEPISVAMAQQKVNNAVALKADYIISTDLSCLMQLQSYINHKGYGIRCLHIADVLMSV